MAQAYLRKLAALTDLRNFPNAAGFGYYGGGVFVNADGTPRLMGDIAQFKTYYVDAIRGSNSNSGRTPYDPFLTMAKALTSVASGDVIKFWGKIKEQLTAPVQVFDVTIVGIGNRPRHADASPVGGDVATNSWTAPDSAAATTPLLKVMQQGWRFANILWYGPSDAESVRLYRDAGSGDDERDASHAEFINCRFASGLGGIYDPGGCFNVKIKDCIFQSQTGFAVYGVGNIGAGQGQWEIRDNRFLQVTNGVKIAAFDALIRGNQFGVGGNPGTTCVLNTNNGGGGRNHVIDNSFQTATANFNTPDVVGCATDVWYNYSIDGVLETGVPA